MDEDAHKDEDEDYQIMMWTFTLYEGYQKSMNVMQQPMDSNVCGINTSPESILIRSYLLFLRKNASLSNSGKFIPQT